MGQVSGPVPLATLHCLEADLEQSLYSLEKLDRSSPDLWPEQIFLSLEFVLIISKLCDPFVIKIGFNIFSVPGVAEFAAIHGSPNNNKPKPKWRQDLQPEDVNTLHSFGSLTAANLMDKVRGLQNLAYQLGLEEAREMTRGKFLNVLEMGSRRRR
ncbi:Protein lin-52 [Nymphon striatum]|nr:Protein lin-52 [Nymphon striatum]